MKFIKKTHIFAAVAVLIAGSALLNLRAKKNLENYEEKCLVNTACGSDDQKPKPKKIAADDYDVTTENDDNSADNNQNLENDNEPSKDTRSVMQNPAVGNSEEADEDSSPY